MRTLIHVLRFLLQLLARELLRLILRQCWEWLRP